VGALAMADNATTTAPAILLIFMLFLL